MKLRVVIDSNMLQSQWLADFLQSSIEHQAVITDYAWMEAYKDQPVRSIQERLQVLESYPRQVVVLKGTKEVSALDARAPGIANRMIRNDGDFNETVDGLKRLRTDDPRTVLGVLLHGEAAASQLEKNLKAATETLPAFAEMEEIFTPAERRIIRIGKPYTADIGVKIIVAARQMAFNFFDRHPHNPKKPTKRSLVNTFLYRFSLAAVLYFVDWIRTGSPASRRHDKIRNDLIDLNFATYATYFNGLMSEDALARDIHTQLRVLLDLMSARVPPDYIDQLAGAKSEHTT